MKKPLLILLISTFAIKVSAQLATKTTAKNNYAIPFTLKAADEKTNGWLAAKLKVKRVMAKMEEIFETTPQTPEI